MALHSFADARRARGLSILAGPGRLNATTAAELRQWRYYIGRLTLKQCGALAGVPERSWSLAEWGGAIHAEHLALVLDAWHRALNGDFSTATERAAPPACSPRELVSP
jgi:hypothetical protein